MNIKYLRFISILFLALGFSSCIDDYNYDFTGKNKVLVVEGFLTSDALNPDTIKIQYSNYLDGSTYISQITGVNASISIVGTGKEIKLIEQKGGNFLPPKDFQIKSSEKYVLKFTLPNGNQYESSPEQIISTPPILKTYDKFNAKSRLSEDGKAILSANEVYLDFQDTPNQKNFYLWRYTHYERIVHCASCFRTNQGTTGYDARKGSCAYLFPSYIRIPYYDYQCDGECYSIFKGREANVMSDVVSDGQVVTGRQIAKVPYYYPFGCLVEIQQMSISPSTYSFYKILESQSQTNGGLADSPPAAIVGNVRNLTNPEERVAGYFSVAEIQSKKHWVKRTDSSGDYDLILGHAAFEEAPSPLDITRPPKAPCVKSATRTNVKPVGWQ
jgi:hypothetical protein